MKKSTKNLVIVGAAVAGVAVAAYLLWPKATAALYIPSQCPTGAGTYAWTGSYICNEMLDGFGQTRCF